MNPQKTRIFIRILVVLAFILTCLGWQQYSSAHPESTGSAGSTSAADDSGGSFNPGYLAYLAFQTFFFNAPAVPDGTPLQVAMSFVAPLTLASSILFEMMLGLRIFFSLLAWRLVVRRSRRLVFMGSALEPGFLRGKQDGSRQLVIQDASWTSSGAGPEGGSAVWSGPGIKVRGVTFRKLDSPRLRLAGVHRSRRIFLCPASDREAWALLDALAGLARPGASSKPGESLPGVTLFCDHMSDRSLINAWRPGSKASSPGMEELLGSLDLEIVESHSLMARQLARLHAPHHLPGASDLKVRAPGIAIHGDGPLASALGRECIRTFHYPSCKNLELVLVRTDAGTGELPADLGLVAELRYLDEAGFLSVPAGSLVPDLVYVLGESIDQLLIRLRAWLRLEFMTGPGEGGKKWQPLFVPVLLDDKDPRVLEGFGAMVSGLGPGLIPEPVLASSLLDWHGLAEGQEVDDTLARTLHNLYIQAQGPLDWPAWKGLSPADREANRAPARHLALKLWALGYRLVLTDDPVPDPEVMALARELDARIKSDPELGNMLMELEHRRWIADKLLSGFVPLPDHVRPGEKAARTHARKHLGLHPDLRVFDQLDQASKDKDKASHELAALLGSCPGLRLERL